jgi:uncharacterized RDD family membrane protein YckC
VDRNFWDGKQWTTMPDEARPADPWAARVEFAYAGFWIRVLANIIDSIVLLVPTGLLTLVEVLYAAPGADLSRAPQSVEGVAFDLARLLAVLLTAVYLVIGWSRGGTLGMRVLGLTVVHAETGARIGVVRAIVRYVGYVVGALFCYLGWLWVAFDPYKQAWHDKLASTIVVYA